MIGWGAVAVNRGHAAIAAASFWGVSTWAAGITPFVASQGSRETSPTVANITPQPESLRFAAPPSTSTPS